MPRLILASAAAFVLGRSPYAREVADGHDGAHPAMHARTRSRDATRRLRAPGSRDPRPDLGPLALTRRH